MQPLFSLLIANFNNSKFLPECIISIFNQSYKNLEVIIVDDASTDNSIEIIKKLINEDKRFRLFQNSRNYGCGYSKNYAVRMARGNYCSFIDSDDILKRDAVRTLAEAFKADIKAAIISSRHELIDHNSKYIGDSNIGSKIKRGSSFLASYQGEITHMAAFRRELYLNSDGINPELKRAVDHDLYFKLEEYGTHVFVDKVLYSYRVHPGGISQKSNALKARYWAIKVREDAYYRRLKSGSKTTNTCLFHLNQMKSDYYYNKLHFKSHKRSFFSKIYLFLSWLYHDPNKNFNQKFLYLSTYILSRLKRKSREIFK